MTDRFSRELLREMRSPIVPVEAPEVVEARRERTVAALREAQLRRLADSGRLTGLRRKVLVAALVLLSSGAVAGTWMTERASAPERSAPVTSSPGVRAAAKTLSASRPATVLPVAAPPGESAADSSALPPAAPAARAVPRASTPLPKPSTLAAENALLSSALAAARRGDDARAVALLTEFLQRYPASELAQNAEVERFRALERRGDVTAAARFARRYLGDHPDGMARDEARRLAVDASARSSANLP